jgi:peptide/nickel transport system substrate-binding protein
MYRWSGRFVILIVLLTACAPVAPPAGTGAQATQVRSPAPASGAPRHGGTIRVGISQEPILLNPLLGSQTIGLVVGGTMLEGLLQGAPDGTYHPQLAEEIPTQQNGGVSADGRTITWKLKKGVLWSDGQPFTSKDIQFTYNVLTNPANPIPNRAGYDRIASVTTPDDATVVMTYRSFYAAFKSHFSLATGAILPEHAFNGDTVIDRKDFNRAPIGTGPFKFKAWASGDTITLERNPYYREKDRPYLDALIFKIVPSREAAVQAFKVGEIDVLWNLIEANIPEFEVLPDTVIQPTPGPQVERLVLNASCPSGPRQGDPACPHPVLGDLRVRQAIELAIDKQALVDKLLFGKTSVATSDIPLGWYAPSLPPSEFNPGEARQLMQEAGWQPGPDGIRVRDGVRARIEYGTTTGDALREQTQQVIQEELRDIGIEVDIKNSPSAVLLGTWADNAPRARGNFDMLMWTANADLDPQTHLETYFYGSQVPTEQTRSGRNYHRILDPQLDQALATAAGTLDQEQRRAAYKTVAERVNADKGHIVLYNRLAIDAWKTSVKGHETNVWDQLAWDAASWWLDK